MPASLADRLKVWSARLASLPTLALPTDYPRPSPPRNVESRQELALSPETVSALRSLASSMTSQAAQQPSEYQLVLSAFVLLLHRYTPDPSLLIASSHVPEEEEAGAAGLPQPLPLLLNIGETETFATLLAQLIEVEAEAKRDWVPLAELEQEIARSQPERGDVPLFRVRVLDATADGSLADAQVSSGLETDLNLAVAKSDGGLTLVLTSNSLLFSPARSQHLLASLSSLLTTLAAEGGKPTVQSILTLPLRTEDQAKILPDPTADLDWCGFKGAITDIFAANAAAHPDRPCVVQSREDAPGTIGDGPSSEKDVWTYAQIDRASNLVAHRLLEGGLERGEVVMIYAARRVELVVAVMGTLKAGGVFSVIDPAYPPTRQTIYLQVSTPRALVVLSSAGTLHQIVQDFIANSLPEPLRLIIPALSLAPSGELTGGSPSDNGKDILASVTHLADKQTGVLLGPDSLGTLSFTSGSEGIPKGVKGRHFSLTHFFPWMSTRFGLSEKERFTMLSGIAHDPIQRDMFTPLFLGAELHVPTADDIGTPGRLAEWMAQSEVTVTHLTPAMGQLLSAQASAQIPTLRNAFFVGDVLTKRDCTRLQALASNVRIINMYGTTETQRAVSYFAIPPVSEEGTFLQTQKDIMPAGQGMIDVQLLVVNRADRTVPCAIGEVGELYVRSGGMAEGYLDPSLTQAKFVQNWFAEGLPERKDTLQGTPEGAYWKGIRDRMYRTGDIGRYLPNGTVECTGRADDQVKIRGFRIELGEIDTHLSRHPLVRENVTLVRRDKNEEKVLVSYFVPQQAGDALKAFESESEDDEDDEDDEGRKRTEVEKGVRKYRKLIKDIREHLKKKLASYAVPSVYIPLGRMPLNPNGKIDKPRLPFPDTSTASQPSKKKKAAAGGAEPARVLTPTEEAVHAIWHRLLPSPPSEIALDDNFFDLGGHSIIATRLVFEIRKHFVVAAPLGLVFDQPTIRGLAAALDALRQGELGFEAPVPSSSSAAATPADVSGEGVSASGEDYAKDLPILTKELAPSYAALPADFSSKPLTVFLTGATGFLGAFILRDLLARRGVDRVKKVVCLVRAKTAEQGLARLRESGEGRAVWDEKWVSEGRVESVLGDLAETKFGLDDKTWSRIAEEADVVVHNGALVHWVYGYGRLRAPNVLSTLTALSLCAEHHPKAFSFVSTTATVETEHFVRLSEQLISSGKGDGVPESDDLDGARTGLTTGYGQTKWVAERLIMEAGKRGLAGWIVRPGYIVGDSENAVTNTDDFIWRLVKGSIQLGLVPDINNTINMVPVDHVARITAVSAVSPPSSSSSSSSPFGAVSVAHVTSRPATRYNDLLSPLAAYGYGTQTTSYLDWRAKLEAHVLEVGDNALFPLLHFVLDDLPTSTKSAELDDSNTRALLRGAGEREGMNVSGEILGRYLAWLIKAGFLDQPTGEKTLELPVLEGDARAIGRSSGA